MPSPAEAAGFKVGDLDHEVDGRDVDTFDDVAVMMSDATEDAHGVRRAAARRSITINATPRLVTLKDRLGRNRDDRSAGLFGSLQAGDLWSHRQRIQEACRLTWSIVRTTLDFRAQLFSGAPGAVSQLHGPLGIATIAGKVASISFLSLIKLAALISVSIGLVNLFPIPILDGGHLLYYGCEAVLGRPLGARAQERWISAGAGGHAGVNGTGNLE